MNDPRRQIMLSWTVLKADHALLDCTQGRSCLVGLYSRQIMLSWTVLKAYMLCWTELKAYMLSWTELKAYTGFFSRVGLKNFQRAEYPQNRINLLIYKDQ